MRLIIIIALVSTLLACGVTPKDYSGAKELQPINKKLNITPLWVLPTGDVPEYAHAQLSPAISDGKIYVANINGNVSAYDIDKGTNQWSQSLNDTIVSGTGVGGGKIFVGTRKAEIVSLDQSNGKEQWRTRISSEMLSTPLYANGSLYVQTIDGKISSIDAKTGKIIWVYTHNTPRLTLRGTASPIIVGHQVVCGFADGKLVSLDANKGEKLWSTTIVSPKGRTDLEKLSDIDGILQSSGDAVYVIGYQGRVSAVSVIDGNIQWSRKLSSFSGLSFDKGHIFISDVEDKVWALDAQTGATLWRQEGLMGREISTPEVIDSAVVVADFDGYVHWMSTDDGQIIARQSLGEIWEDSYPTYHETLADELEGSKHHRHVTVKPLAVNDTLLVRDNDGALAAFRVEK